MCFSTYETRVQRGKKGGGTWKIGAYISICGLVCFVHTSAPLFYHVTHQS